MTNALHFISFMLADDCRVYFPLKMNQLIQKTLLYLNDQVVWSEEYSSILLVWNKTHLNLNYVINVGLKYTYNHSGEDME